MSADPEHVADVRRYYDHNSDRFERFGHGGASIHRAVWGPGVQTRAAAIHYLDELLLAQLRPLAGTPRVVDLGCGLGASLMYLAERLPVAAEGITISARQAERAAALIAAAPLRGRVRSARATTWRCPPTSGHGPGVRHRVLRPQPRRPALLPFGRPRPAPRRQADHLRRLPVVARPPGVRPPPPLAGPVPPRLARRHADQPRTPPPSWPAPRAWPPSPARTSPPTWSCAARATSPSACCWPCCGRCPRPGSTGAVCAGATPSSWPCARGPLQYRVLTFERRP